MHSRGWTPSNASAGHWASRRPQGPSTRVLKGCSRVCFRCGPYPGRWSAIRALGPTTARFDHQLPDASGAPWAQDRVINRSARSPWLVAYDLAADLELLDLIGSYPTRAGASMLIHHGSRPRARLWSRALSDKVLQMILRNAVARLNDLPL